MSLKFPTENQPANRSAFIEHILKNGKTSSWHNLAIQFNIGNARDASNTWNNYRTRTGAPVPPKNIQMSNVPFTVQKTSAIKAATEYTMDLEDRITKFEENVAKGTAEVSVSSTQEITNLEELIQKCKIDLTKWAISKYTQNFWNNKYQVKAFLVANVKTEVQNFKDEFVEFLKTYKSTYVQSDWDYASILKRGSENVQLGCLILNKQDAHLDKFDVHGNNDLVARFKHFEGCVTVMLNKAKLSTNVTQILYVLGSDEFNSEWTGMTTKGTPQKNAVPFHQAFQLICQHEVNVISSLLATGANVELMYMPGNHDEYVGWHLIAWLEAYFKDAVNLTVNKSPAYTKYFKFGKSAMMFNHGDQQKPAQLAATFPQGFREQWSSCKHQYIFTGDKHNELSMDIAGIRFYRLHSVSGAKSTWDEKMGFVNKAGEMTGFLVSTDNGITDQYREML